MADSASVRNCSAALVACAWPVGGAEVGGRATSGSAADVVGASVVVVNGC
jgi:hypothetical protein